MVVWRFFSFFFLLFLFWTWNMAHRVSGDPQVRGLAQIFGVAVRTDYQPPPKEKSSSRKASDSHAAEPHPSPEDGTATTEDGAGLTSKPSLPDISHPKEAAPPAGTTGSEDASAVVTSETKSDPATAAPTFGTFHAKVAELQGTVDAGAGSAESMAFKSYVQHLMNSIDEKFTRHLALL